MNFAFSHQKRLLVIAILAVSVLLFLFSTQAATSMFGLFKKYDVYLSPEIHGRITVAGKPIKNVVINRTLTYADEISDQSKTNNDGEFYFPEQIIRSRLPGQMLDETRVFQTVDLNYKDKEYLLWYTVTEGKAHKNIYNKLQQLNCDLTMQEEKNYFINYEYPEFTHNVLSICRWKNK
ncbi:DUF6795 domain-containing protein [Colwellia sp. KU-HH00111]|uniref:DUF6795 domain-containing protein n=1 Tax=Colwellia sp. KU-HH00111 TaxID=3127652 RepID=UPI003365B14E